MLERSEEKDEALEEEWERFAADTSLCRLDIRSLYGLSGIKKSRRRGVFVRYPYIAACAAAVVALLALQHIFFTGSTVSSTCLVASSEGKSGYNLPDGSYIWLNSGARLYYDDNLGVSGTRKVRLEGEAFFDVEKSGRPFVVDLDGKTRIKVLGTSFNVRNSDLWNEYEITLNSGRVQIISEGLKDIFLKPGQQCILSKDSSSAMVRNVDVSDVCSWTSDMLVFENSSLAEIALKLEHWYNTRIYFADGVDRDIRLSFKLGRESREDTFSLIGHLASVDCSFATDDTVTISPATGR